MTGRLADLPLAALTVDEGERPKGPELGELTQSQRAAGRHLAAIHRHHLRDMARISMVIDRIEAGDEAPEALRQVVLATDMAQNYAAVGTLCGHECRVLTFHHDAEEHGLFPQLEAKGIGALSAVVQRLRAEHAVVHELLERLTRAGEQLETQPTEQNFTAARDVFRKLAEVVWSHFRYEETELEEAIGLFAEGF